MRIKNPDDRVRFVWSTEARHNLETMAESSKRLRQALQDSWLPHAEAITRMQQQMAEQAQAARLFKNQLDALRSEVISVQQNVLGERVRTISLGALPEHLRSLATQEALRRVESLQESIQGSFKTATKFTAKGEKGKPKDGESLEFRIASVVAYILPKKYAEEWIGDLREAVHELDRKAYPRWSIILITASRILVLVWSLIRIKFTDLITGIEQRQPK